MKSCKYLVTDGIDAGDDEYQYGECEKKSSLFTCDPDDCCDELECFDETEKIHHVGNDGQLHLISGRRVYNADGSYEIETIEVRT